MDSAYVRERERERERFTWEPAVTVKVSRKNMQRRKKKVV